MTDWQQLFQIEWLPLGTFINVGCILIGGIAGLLLSRQLPDNTQRRIRSYLAGLTMIAGSFMMAQGLYGGWKESASFWIFLLLGLIALLSISFGNLIGTSELSLKNYLQMFDAAKRLNHLPLGEFTKQRVRLRPKLIEQVIEILKSDLAFDIALTKQTLGSDFLQNMGIENQNDFSKGGELALLSYAKKGGRIKSIERNVKAFIILPESKKGLSDTDRTVLLLSSGVVHVVSSLNTGLAKYALGQLGVPTTILRVGRLFDDSGPVCLLDEVGNWYRIINGERTRSCNFNQVLMQTLRGDGWRSTFDEQLTPISYQQISDIMTQNDTIQFVY